MKRSAKLAVTVVFGCFVLALLLGVLGGSYRSNHVLAKGSATPTPKPAGNTAANVKANTNMGANAAPANAATPQPPAGGKKITKSFTLGKDSLSEYGEVAFDHETHASKNYSPDGKSQIACIECHHTDAPKSALQPPLVTSERDTVLTMAVYQASDQKVSECRSCHFQDGNEPDGKEMPKATYPDGKTKTLTNELAYHINCNTCHDAAFKLRPELKQRPGFATSKDCTVCHKTN